MRQPNHATSTEERILDIAERLVQTLGFNGFSYADIAGELGVSAASIHYHFATKTNLGARLIERYAERFAQALSEISSSTAPVCEQLERYANLYEQVVAGERMCLCGMMAAELGTLPDAMRAPLEGFFHDNEAWLARTLSKGRECGELPFEGEPEVLAAAITGSLQGAMLIARARGGAEAFRASAKLMLSRLCKKSAA